MEVEFRTRGPQVLGYSVVLLTGDEEERETVRVYDAAHRFNEMHRYTRSDGKQRGVRFHDGTLGEGMRAAIAEVEEGYGEMIESWKRR